jgi:Tol biopolymer transport system component
LNLWIFNNYTQQFSKELPPVMAYTTPIQPIVRAQIKRTRIASISLLIALALAIAACGADDSIRPTSALSARQIDTVAPVAAPAHPTAQPVTLAATSTSTSISQINRRARIAYVQTADRANGEYDLYTMNPDGGDRQQLTQIPGIETTPAWSMDGQQLAFVATRDSKNPSDCANGYVEFRCNFEIYTIHADGTGLRRVTTSPNYDRDPAWSPDGRRIIFSSRATGAPEGYLYVVDPDGANLKQLTSGSDSDQAPSWAPDGTRIAFMRSTEQDIQVYAMAADGSQVTQLTRRGTLNARPAWSPDGAWIAYVTVIGADEDAPGALAMMRPDGSDGHIIDTDVPVSPGYAPSWAPDGRTLLYVGDEGGYYTIYRVNLDGSNFARVTDYTAFFSAPAWSPAAK